MGIDPTLVKVSDKRRYWVPAEERLADPVAAAAGAVEVRVGGRGEAVQGRQAGPAGVHAVVVAAATVAVPLVQDPCLKMSITVI